MEQNERWLKKENKHFERANPSAGLRINSYSRLCSITEGSLVPPHTSWKDQLTQQLRERLEEGGSDLGGRFPSTACLLRPRPVQGGTWQQSTCGDLHGTAAQHPAWHFHFNQVFRARLGPSPREGIYLLRFLYLLHFPAARYLCNLCFCILALPAVKVQTCGIHLGCRRAADLSILRLRQLVEIPRVCTAPRCPAAPQGRSCCRCRTVTGTMDVQVLSYCRGLIAG